MDSDMDSRTDGKKLLLSEDLEDIDEAVCMKKTSANSLTILKEVMFLGADGSKFFKGTLNQRTVMVKRVNINDEAILNASREMEIHVGLENKCQQILQLHALDKDSSHIYLCFQNWTCTVGDLVRVGANKVTPCLTASRRIALEQLLTGLRCWEPSGTPSPLLVSVIKDMLMGVFELHREGIIHRDISEDSFFLTVDGDSICSRLANLSICKLKGDSGTIGVQNRKAPEQLQRKPYEGLANDIHSLGGVVGFCITQGLQVFNDHGNLTQQATNILQNLHEAYQFFIGLVKTPYHARLTAARALQEPFFWPVAKQAQFYLVASPLLKEALSGQSKMLQSDLQNLQSDLQKTEARVLGQSGDWYSILDTAFRTKLDDERQRQIQFYRYKTIADLIRLIRNTIEHYRQSIEIQGLVGLSQETVLEYFHRKFPNLLREAYQIIYVHFPTAPDFVSAFLDG